MLCLYVPISANPNYQRAEGEAGIKRGVKSSNVPDHRQAGLDEREC